MILSGCEVDIRDPDVLREVKGLLASNEVFDMPATEEGLRAGTPILGYRGFAIDENDKYAGVEAGVPFVYSRDEVMHNEQSREGYSYGLNKDLIQQHTLHQAVLHNYTRQHIPEGGYEVWEIEGTATQAGFTAQDIHIRGDKPYFKISKDEIQRLVR